MSRSFDHLGLTRWPFTNVPDRPFCTFIADREQLKMDVEALLEHLSRRDVSQIRLFWAWFGAGKTHTLYFLANRVAATTEESFTNNVIHTVYSEFPDVARGFVDLYRSFAVSLNVDELIDAFLEVCTGTESARLQKELMLAYPDLFNALRALAMGRPRDQMTALRWIRADALPLTELRGIGIAQRLDSSEDAVRVLSALTRMFNHAAQSTGQPSSVLLWILDEYQRIVKASSRALADINAGLHKTFNACPNGLSLFISFSGRPAKSLPPFFSEELRDRIGRTKVMVLPPMVSAEGLLFVKDVLVHCRPPQFNHASPWFPFTREACDAILEEVSKRGEIKPRALMQAFGAVLEEADRQIETGAMVSVSPEFARSALAERVVLEEHEEE